MKQKTLVAALVAAGIVLAGVGGYTRNNHFHFGPDNVDAATAQSMPATQPTPAPQVASAPVAALPDFSGIVAQNGPAVVNVTVTGKAGKTGSSGGGGEDSDDPMSQFFRQFGVPTPRAQPMQGLGSGFIVSPDGVILTNAHVVSEAGTVTVRLTDKREFKAKVVGVDKPSDVAVIKIDAKDLPTVRLDKADDIKVGEWVVAIGSPFGFDNSATAGIVSAKSRALPGDTYVPFIQTDVAVNPGNSGGPLFNTKGEVIGINSQIYTRSGGYQGVSFAIPIDVALNIENQLVQHGHVTRGKLGVTIQDVNQALAKSFGLKKPGGALVSSVEKNGAASAAGLEPGDVIVRYNGKDITSSSELPVLVASTQPGSTAKVDVVRKGQSHTLDVKVGELKNQQVASAAQPGTDHGRLGLAVRPLNSEERQQAGIDGGVIVEDASGPAADAGIQPGDVILAFNGTPVKSGEQLKQLVSKSGKDIALLVQRGDAKIFVPVDLG